MSYEHGSRNITSMLIGADLSPDNKCEPAALVMAVSSVHSHVLGAETSARLSV